jgi:Holliday junction resolvase RusA-like endonuclease
VVVVSGELLLHIVIPGRPHPLQRARHGQHGTYDTAVNRAAKDRILWMTRWKQTPYARPVSILIHCSFTKGGSGDVDNLAKTVLDAFNKVVIADDRLVKWLCVSKNVAAPKDETEVWMWASDPHPLPARRHAAIQRRSESSRRGRATSIVRRPGRRTASTPSSSEQSAQP